MGRKTLESFPGGLPLKNRVNIVISRDKNYQVKDAVVVHSIEEALEEVKKYKKQDVYVIGGDSIYKQMLPYCNKAHVTKIDFAYEADTFFPNLDEDEQWEITERSEEQTYLILSMNLELTREENKKWINLVDRCYYKCYNDTE